MYGSGIYGQEPYGGEHLGGASVDTIQPPVVAAPFTVYAPAVTVTGQQSIEAPLITSAFQVFAPSIISRGRPLAEDIRIMRVNRAE